MGKYLDICRKFEAERKGKQPHASPAQQQETASPATSPENAFLEKHVPPHALKVFPDWEGLLIKSKVLDLSVWVVRSREEGEELARETGHPALRLDDILSQKGKTPAEARAHLLPLLRATCLC
jgi:hypothetical protein